MTPIIDVQYRLRELGRLRMGMKGKKGAPVKLNTWRLTSASKELLEAAAEVYGGTVQVWQNAPNEGEHFELVTDAQAIDVVIPANEAAFSQWMELWAGGGCKKRCDSRRQLLVDRPCSCPSDINERMSAAQDGKACKPVTRLNVMLPKLPDIGVWRLETHGYHAATELAGFQQLADIATQRGQMIAARLRIDHRMVKRPGQPPNRFTVPVIEVSEVLSNVLGAMGLVTEGVTVSLPGPVEARGIPDARARLPKQTPDWGIEDEDGPDREPPANGTPPRVVEPGVGDRAVSGSAAHISEPELPAWLNQLCDEFGEGEVLDAANSLREARRPGSDPLQQVIEISKADEDQQRLLRAHLEATAERSEESEAGSLVRDGESRPDDASGPASDAIETAARIEQKRQLKRHKGDGELPFRACESKIGFKADEVCADCGWEPFLSGRPIVRTKDPTAVEHPCPRCGSECKPWQPDKPNSPSWRCTNPDCSAEDDATPWVSFHDDPWKPGGEIDQLKDSARSQSEGTTEPSSESQSSSSSPNSSDAEAEQSSLGLDAGPDKSSSPTVRARSRSRKRQAP